MYQLIDHREIGVSKEDATKIMHGIMPILKPYTSELPEEICVFLTGAMKHWEDEWLYTCNEGYAETNISRLIPPEDRDKIKAVIDAMRIARFAWIEVRLDFCDIEIMSSVLKDVAAARP
jgi:hypothetical protein